MRNPDSYRRVITEAHKARLRELRTIHGHAATSQRGHTRTYQSWMSMKERCDDPRHKSYAAYGRRGISYCERWANFVEFLKDMGERPTGTTLGRINHERHYAPGNCEWQTYKKQANNRRNSRWLISNGECRTIAEWSDKTNIPQDTLKYRIDRLGWPVTKALTKVVRAILPKGQTKRGAQYSKIAQR